MASSGSRLVIRTSNDYALYAATQQQSSAEMHARQMYSQIASSRE
jgi:hypothetical protein